MFPMVVKNENDICEGVLINKDGVMGGLFSDKEHCTLGERSEKLAE